MRLVKTIFCAALLSTAALAAHAGGFTYTFVDSWQVNQGLVFDIDNTLAPLPAYTAQETAALLFGGNAADYAISTSLNSVDHLAYYSVLGAGQMTLAEDYFSKYLGQYYASPLDVNGLGESTFSFAAASAYVTDNFVTDTNYAFRITAAVPEPDSLALLLAGLGVIGALARRRQPATRLTCSTPAALA